MKKRTLLVITVCGVLAALGFLAWQASTEQAGSAGAPSAKGSKTGYAPKADAAFEYYSVDEVATHERREWTFSEGDSGTLPTDEERLEALTEFLETGILYPFEKSWRRFRLKYPDTRLPYVEIRLKTLNDAGELVDLASTPSWVIKWISNEITAEEYPFRQAQDMARNKMTYSAWPAPLHGRDKWFDMREKVIREHGAPLHQYRKNPYAMKRLRIPILPLDLEQRFPELHRRMRKEFQESGGDPFFDTFAFLRAGEWYQFRLNMRYDDMPESSGVVTPKARTDDLVDAFLKAPPPGAVESGEILAMDLLVLPNQYPPFDPTQNQTKETIAQGKHVICRTKQLVVTIDEKIRRKHNNLRLWHIHNIDNKGYYSTSRVSEDTAQLQFKMHCPRPGGLVLIKNQRDAILMLRNLSYEEANLTLCPETADYVRNDPVNFKVHLSGKYPDDVLERLEIHLALGIEDVAPVAQRLARGRRRVRFSANPGTYYVQLHYPDWDYDLIGKVSVTNDHSGQTVPVEPLDANEQEQWEEFKPRRILKVWN